MIVHGVASAKEAGERTASLLKRVGLLPDMALRYPHEFSGGQRQRVAIARALALSPEMVVADEAVSALDVSVKAQVLNLMLDLQAELGLAYLFISHDMAVVERVAHRIAVMYLGEIVEIGPRAEVMRNSAHPYTRKLLSAVPVPDPARRRKRGGVAVEELPSPIRAPDWRAPRTRCAKSARPFRAGDAGLKPEKLATCWRKWRAERIRTTRRASAKTGRRNQRLDWTALKKWRARKDSNL